MNMINVLQWVILSSVTQFSSFCSSEQRPNIVFVLADDYGFNDVGYHGSEIKTPNIDRLAKHGVKLENYYVQPICTPTRSQFMSGRYQIHTGLQHEIIWASQPNGLPLDDLTIATTLRSAGYATHAIGKWHLGFFKEDYLPTNRGFDSFYGFLTGSEDYYTHYRCYPLQHQSRSNISLIRNNIVCGFDFRHNEDPVANQNGNYSTHIFTQKAVNVIKNHDVSKPMFMYLAFQAVHAPLQVPLRYQRQYSHIKDNNRRMYAGMVTCMDEGIGNISQALADAGMWNNTVFIFSTDNGGQIYAGGNNWPLRGWKASLWEGGMHGVGFVHSPLLRRPARVSNELIHVSDWYPTMMSLAGLSGNHTRLRLDGVDQWDTISIGVPSKRRELLHNIDILHRLSGEDLYPGLFDTRVRAAIRSGDFKLITGDPGNGSWVRPPGSKSMYFHESSRGDLQKNLWLFNITRDKSERNDLSQRYPDVVRNLLERLAHYNSTAVPPIYPPEDPNCDPRSHGGFWGPWMS